MKTTSILSLSISLFSLLSTSSPVPLPPTPQAAAAPSLPKRCTALLENNPWQITNLIAFTAWPQQQSQFKHGHRPGSQASTPPPSYLTFSFTDTNTGLGLNTSCSRTVGAGASLADGNDWFACQNSDVEFMYTGGALRLQRSYTDDCIGSYPYNSVTAFGTAELTPTVRNSQTGSTVTQSSVSVPVTSEISKRRM